MTVAHRPRRARCSCVSTGAPPRESGRHGNDRGHASAALTTEVGNPKARPASARCDGFRLGAVYTLAICWRRSAVRVRGRWNGSWVRTQGTEWRADLDRLRRVPPYQPSLGPWGRHPAQLDPAPLVAVHRLSKRDALGRLRRDIRGPGGKTGRIATVPTIRATAPITTTFPSLRAAGAIATIPAPLANLGTTTDEVVAVDASGGAADRATGPIVAALLPPAVPAVPAAPATTTVAREAAAVAALQSPAALSVA
jgi:hypothetical protein